MKMVNQLGQTENSMNVKAVAGDALEASLPAYIFATPMRKVTVHAASPEEARAKACIELDRRCQRSGSEPPVAWDLVDITNGDNRKVDSAAYSLSDMLWNGCDFDEAAQELCLRNGIAIADLQLAYEALLQRDPEAANYPRPSSG